MTALCPRDGTPLVAAPNALGPGGAALECPKCSGVLSEWKVAQGFFASLGLTLADLHVAVSKTAPTAGAQPVACTSCGKAAMKPFAFKGVELDVCVECGAAWFDRGELSRVSGGKVGAAPSAAPAKQVPGERAEVVGVFEMWWDCAYCDTKGLLGASNRHCPKCGAAQDADRRYFPPPGQETAANHEFDGADQKCPACSTPNGAKAVHCRQCGSPMDGSAKVKTVADRSSAAPKVAAPASASPPRSGGRPWWLYALGLVAMLGCGFCGVATFWTTSSTATVTGHEWARDIDVEALTPGREKSWCDALPGDAYDVTRSRQQRSTNKVQDGEECSTRDVDRGNGTFERRKECKPKYRQEPVYDMECNYTVDRWKKKRAATARGTSLEGVKWPTVTLTTPGSCRGCEREGPRHERFTVDLKGPKGEAWSCDVGEPKWRGLAKGASLPVKVRVLVNSVDCSSL